MTFLASHHYRHVGSSGDTKRRSILAEAAASDGAQARPLQSPTLMCVIRHRQLPAVARSNPWLDREGLQVGGVPDSPAVCVSHRTPIRRGRFLAVLVHVILHLLVNNYTLYTCMYLYLFPDPLLRILCCYVSAPSPVPPVAIGRQISENSSSLPRCLIIPSDRRQSSGQAPTRAISGDMFDLGAGGCLVLAAVCHGCRTGVTRVSNWHREIAISLRRYVCPLLCYIGKSKAATLPCAIIGVRGWQSEAF